MPIIQLKREKVGIITFLGGRLHDSNESITKRKYIFFLNIYI